MDAYYTLVPNKENTTVDALVDAWSVVVFNGMKKKERKMKGRRGERDKGILG